MLMSQEDLRKLVAWFEAKIIALEAGPNYPEICDGVERLKTTVEGFKEGLDDFSDDAFPGEVA